MFKRLFYAAVGLGAGAALGVYVVRKVEQTQRRLTPEAIADRTSARVESIGERFRTAIADGRAAAAAKEVELRATYRVQQPPEPVAPRGGPSPGRP